jgi:hypothetical protein
VDDKSATLGLSPNRETAIALDLDHRSICKFDSIDDDNYEQVQDNIRELVEDAIQNARVKAHARDSTVSLPRMDSSSKTESKLDIVSLAESIDGSTMSLALSEQDPADQSEITRRSTSTSTAEQTGEPGRQEKSPNLFSSIGMNISDSDGLKFRAAAAEGQKDLLKSMLDKGAPIDNSGVWDGYTALADAALHSQEEVVKFLLEQGANPAFHCISMTKKYGSKENTPLSLAAGKGNIGSMKILLDFHEYTTAELDAAFRAAKSRNRQDAMKLIQEYGGGLY